MSAEIPPADVQSEHLMEDPDKRDKFLRLLGGKKAKNQEASDNWIKKSRSEKDETALAKGLEEQYTNTMQQVVEGKTRRKEGIGYMVSSAEPERRREGRLDERSHADHNKAEETRSRHRSRSPLKPEKPSQWSELAKDLEHNGTQKKTQDDESPAAEAKPAAPSVSNKKQFYMQFKKAS